MRHATGILAAALALAAAGGCAERPAFPETAEAAGRPPRLRPDFAGATVPPNIAPLNVVVAEPGEAVAWRLTGEGGTPLAGAAEGGAVRFPPRAWRAMLEANRGGAVRLEVAARQDGRWRRFEAVTVRVAAEPIDPYLSYRYMRPVYNRHAALEIRQRDLTSFAEGVILDSRPSPVGCLNCHTYHQGSPDRMLVHVRSPHGPAMILATGGRVERIDTRSRFNKGPASYSTWHPSGRRIAFSSHRLKQMFHTCGENREVYDAASDMCVYDVTSRTVTSCKPLARVERCESWPRWGPDGRYLYYTSARARPLAESDQVRYDLMRVPYNAETETFGEPEVLVAAEAVGRSILQPRVAPDGRRVLVTVCDYGGFPIYQPSADLAVVDLRARTLRDLEAVNSPLADTWHCWSRSGRWVAFASKRGTGVFTKVYFTYAAEDGTFGKPFVLPQEDPRLYDALLQVYNVPELMTGPVTIPERAWVRAIAGATREGVSAATGASPPPEGPTAAPHGLGPDPPTDPTVPAPQ